MIRPEDASGDYIGVPTISVIPDNNRDSNEEDDGTPKYTVLEDNLRDLHDIIDMVQEMKDSNFRALSVSNQILKIGEQCMRISCSCPMLNDSSSSLADSAKDFGPDFNVSRSPSHPDISCASGKDWRRSSSGKMLRALLGTGRRESIKDIFRRRSWAALEDLTSASTNDNTQAKPKRDSYRSGGSSESSSSLSDPGGCFDDDDVVTPPKAKERRAKGKKAHSSTTTTTTTTANVPSSRSLNEADLRSSALKCDHQRGMMMKEKSTAKPATREQRFAALMSRLPLQKSLSTPSIVAAIPDSGGRAQDAIDHTSSPPNLPHPPRAAGTKSSSPNESGVSLAPIQGRNNFGIEDRQEKRRKRGSLFFRKKKQQQQQQQYIKVTPTQLQTGFSVNSEGREYYEDESLLLGANANPEDCAPLILYTPADFSDQDLETDPFLGLQDEEPENWTGTVTKEILRTLKGKEIKRQEHIYEFILTEKHHCLTLILMQKVFAHGMRKYLHVSEGDIDRMFPRLADLTEIHLQFLRALRARQKERPIVESVRDILADQFCTAEAAGRLKSVYGEFCSHHTESVDMYKEYARRDPRFPQFVKHCQNTVSLLKKKGIPECILFVTQRLTKYPLLIEPLIKTCDPNDSEELRRLSEALTAVKEILVRVDWMVAEREKEDRQLEIFNKIDAKSYTTYQRNKFKKSDIFSHNRKLKFEGVATLMQARAKMQLVHVVVLSDVLFFLIDTNNGGKMLFFTPDNKPGVIGLQKVLVREKAGTEKDAIYLISSNAADPEMFELKIHNPKDKQIWIKSIREAAQNCPNAGGVSGANGGNRSGDDMVKAVHKAPSQELEAELFQIIDNLKQKDAEQAQLYEEKISLLVKLVTAARVLNTPASEDDSIVLPEVPSFANLLDPVRINETREKVLEVIRRYKEREEMEKGSACVVPSIFTMDSEECNIMLQMISNLYQLLAVTTQQSTMIETLKAKVQSVDKKRLYVGGNGGGGGGGGNSNNSQSCNQQLEQLRNMHDKLIHDKEVWLAQKRVEQEQLEQSRQALLQLQEQVRKEQADVTEQREQLYRKLELLSSKGLGLDVMDNACEEGIIVDPQPIIEATDTATSPSGVSSVPGGGKGRRTESIRWKGSSGSGPVVAGSGGGGVIPAVNSTAPIPAQLPLNLISATNEKKVSSSVRIKQKLPMKLAALSSSTNTSATSPEKFCDNQQQQLLPMKLSESSLQSNAPSVMLSPVDYANKKFHTIGGGNSLAYQRLGETLSSSSSSGVVGGMHSRTGSSPAMMQGLKRFPSNVSGGGGGVSGSDGGNGNNKAERTNTYPKIPEKYRDRVQSKVGGDNNNGGSQTDTNKRRQSGEKDEKIIFF